MALVWCHKQSKDNGTFTVESRFSMVGAVIFIQLTSPEKNVVTKTIYK